MRLRGIGERRYRPSKQSQQVRYRVINKPPVARIPAPVPWDELTRDANGRPVIDEKLILP